METKNQLCVLPLGRATFDVDYARERLEAMLSAIENAGFEVVGPRALLFDAEATRAAIGEIAALAPARVLILQVTFTDAAMTVEAARALDAELSIWAVPEPRTGGRLRLNAFCGLNLAAHALGLENRDFGWHYGDPDAAGTEESLRRLLAGGRSEPVPELTSAEGGEGTGAAAAASLRGARIGRIGEHPQGFHTCAYDEARLDALAGVTVEPIALDGLFERARGVSAAEADDEKARAAHRLAGLEAVDQGQLDRSLRLRRALDDLRAEGRYDAFAVRCWPETFTEYGGAVCGPVAMMGEARTPCACEADVYGALTALLLQRVADAPAFLTDLVDIDVEDDTGVVWHCGQAPTSMASPATPPRATIHTNRKMPLLYEFALKPGRVTFLRISQARGRTFAVIGGGEMLDRPMAFTGTSGVVRFDGGARATLDRLIGARLEHHLALAYGDHRDALRSAAATLGIPVLAL